MNEKLTNRTSAAHKPQRNRIIAFIMALVTALPCLLSAITAMPQTVRAAAPVPYPGEVEVKPIQAGQNLVQLDGQVWPDFNFDYIAYVDKIGKTWPAYCVEPNKPGASYSNGGYTVDASALMNDVHVYGAVINGHPFKTPAELGVNSEYEAYYITKLAIWSIVHPRYEQIEDFSANGSANAHIITAFKALRAKAMATTSMGSGGATISANPVGTVVKDTTNKTRTFSVTPNSPYKVEIDGTAPSGTKITDMSGATKTTFAAGEQFKVVIPIASISADGTFNLKLTATSGGGNAMVFEGIPKNDPNNHQNYALVYEAAVTGSGTADYEKDDVTVTPSPTPSTPPSDPPPADGALRIVKLEAGTTRPLAGAEFRVTKADGGVVGHYYTDANGQINISPLNPGAYYVDEVTPPRGYLLDVNSHKDVILVADRQAVLTFENATTPKLKVIKVDADTSAPIADTVFEVSLDGGSEKYVIRTNGMGEASLGDVVDLKEGTYTVKEISVSAPYLLDPSNSEKSVKLVAGTTTSVTFKNQTKPGLIIRKYIEGTNILLDGAEFSVSKMGGDGGIVWEGVVSGGVHFLENLDEGWYTVTELAPPDGYMITTKTKNVHLEAGKTVEIKFDNRPRPKLEIVKVDQDGKPLAGAVFHIRKAEGATTTEVTTDIGGRVRLENLDEAVYIVDEITPPSGYLLDTNHHREIQTEWGTTKSLVFTNKLKPALIIKKFDEDTGLPLKGAEFSVAKKGGSIFYEGITPDSGAIRLDGLDEGWVTITELAAPHGYLKTWESKDVLLEAGKVVELKFDNRLRPSLEILKVDEETKQPLAGAKFRVTATESKTTGEYITDANGRILLNNLNEEIYSVEEITAPSGYLLESQHKDIALEWGKTKQLVFTNKARPKLRILKVDAVTGETLKNAEFRVTKVEDKTVSEYITGADGTILIENLDEAVYRAEEFMPPNGYLIYDESKEIALEWGKTKTLKFDDIRKPTLIFTKLNDLTDKPIANAVFRVDYEQPSGGVGSQGGVTTIGTYRTDANGRITIPQVSVGWYILTEIQAAPGFSLPSNPVTRLYLSAGQNAYTAEELTSISGGQSAAVKAESGADFVMGVDTNGELIYNFPLNSIVIKKTDVNTGALLAGAAFELYRADEQVSGVPGTAIGRYTTDNSGIIVIVGLNPGFYVVKEVSPPPNYLIAENSQQNGFLKSDDTTILEFSFANIPYGSLLITKVDGQSKKPLQGARFKVTDGAGAAAGNTNGEYTTDADGEILIPHLKPDAYVITEISAPSGYAIDGTPQTVQIGTDGKTYKVTFVNQPFGGLLVKKVDAQTNKPLMGARFKVTDSTGAAVTSGGNGGTGSNGGAVGGSGGNANGEYVTDTNGEFTISSLKPGAYIVTELSPPQGYALDGTPQTVNVTADGKAYTLTFADQPLGTLVIKKYNSVTHAPLSGAEFKVTTATGAVIGTGNGTYATDSSGTIQIPALDKGSYIVREVKAPAGFILEEQAQTITVDYGKTYTLDFYNKPKSSLQIIKVDSETKKPLKDARFTVYKANGEVLGTYDTDGDGLIIISGIDPGWLKIVEVKAPTGYQADDIPRDVEITANQFLKITFENKSLASIIVKKIDDKSGAPLAGAVFVVQKQDGRHVGEYTTDRDGVFTVPNAEQGYYIIREQRSPDGYLLDETPKTVEVKTVAPTVVTFTNKKLTALQIVKTDEKTGEPLGGARFSVEKQNGERVGGYVTDKTGLINIPTLDPDFYVVRELAAPQGYLLDNSPQTVQVKTAAPTVVTFTNRRISGLQIIKVDASTNTPLSGARFTVYKKSGDVVGEYTTDQNGVAIVDGLVSGWYKIAETKAPTGYLISEAPKDVEVTHGEFIRVVFADERLAPLEIKKVDEKTNEPLAGAVFKVTKMNGEVVGDDFTTGKDGLIHIPTLAPGFYAVSELKSPQGYLLDNAPKTVEVKTNTPTVLTVTNRKQSGLQIIKVDASTNTPLSGARFTVYKKSGDVVGEYTTDQNGVAIVDGLVSGWYKIAETKAPTGYLISEAPKDVEVTHGEFIRVVFADERLASLQIKKIDEVSGAALAGAVFTVERQNGEKIFTSNNGTEFVTDTQGLINIPALAPGFYIVREVKAPVNYVIDGTPKTVEVKTDAPTIVTFANKPLAGLRIVKLNSTTRAPIEGVEFSVSRMNGERIDDAFRGYTFKTDRTGQIYVPNLADGYYLVTETKAADGYFLDAEPKTVLVQSGKTTLLEVLNTPMSGLLIVKTDEKTGRPLAGVVFDVKRVDGQFIAGSILDKNQPNTPKNSPNKSTSPNGDITGSYTTDANGRILINGLDAGEYHVTERKQLDGYELDTAVHAVTITPGKLATLQLTNRQKAGLRLIKIDSVSKKPLYNVEFCLYDASGKVIGNYYTDNNGVIDFAGLLVEGKYTIRETRPAPNYYPDDTPRTVNFKSGEYTEIRWENVAKAGQIQILKKSADDNEVNGLPANSPLANAVFEVYEYKSGNLVDRFVSGTDGRAISKPLPLGRYTVREVQAPQYYKLSDKALDVELEFGGQILKFEYADYSANTGVFIKKVGNVECMPGDTIRYDFKAVQNVGTVPLTDFYWRDIIPTDAARLTKLITGTYNQSLKFKVMITTNKGDSRVIADNLSTTRNNVVDCSAASLGLKSDEFVTSITLLFGTIKAGFCQVETPQIFVKVLTTLPNGYEFANKADIGGKYGREWVVGNTTSLTRVYRKDSPLPRTGY